MPGTSRQDGSLNFQRGYLKTKMKGKQQHRQQRSRERPTPTQFSKIIVPVSTDTYGGRLQEFYHVWQKFTKDKLILSWIQGYKIPFIKKPIQNRACCQKLPGLQKYSIIICTLLKKGIITKCASAKDQFLSSFFLIPKTDNSYRFILNLKKLNEFVIAPHFKLDTYKSVKDLLFKNVYMATLDLKDAYFMVPIYQSHEKYLRFRFQETIYEFNSLPMGLSTAPYMFTKLLKPIFNFFRQKGILCLILILGSTKAEVQCNNNFMLDILQSLGFFIHIKKSQLKPSQSCQISVLFTTVLQ